MSVRLSLIVAIAENRVIGRDNGLPWRLPSDLKHFKATTMGKPIVMGRKTFESIGRALPGRDNIVVTRGSDIVSKEVHVAYSLDEAMGLAEDFAVDRGVDEVFIIGGAQIYAEAIGQSDRLYVTEVAGSPDGDVVFPAIDPKVWREVARGSPVQGENDSAAMAFVVYERITT
jgi:dihydrofolate reductase